MRHKKLCDSRAVMVDQQYRSVCRATSHLWRVTSPAIGAGTVLAVCAVAHKDFWSCGPPMYLAHTEFFNLFKDWSRECNHIAYIVLTVRRAVSVYARVSLYGAGPHVCQPSNFRRLIYPPLLFWVLLSNYLAYRPILCQDVNQRKPFVDSGPNYILL